ncbi:MAG TPA: hypothetical protein VMT42_02520 [candidate division Zixibacteria bacterium]|nr:hypothetical protein [candidate division Zixibacteria bacterium]
MERTKPDESKKRIAKENKVKDEKELRKREAKSWLWLSRNYD